MLKLNSLSQLKQLAMYILGPGGGTVGQSVYIACGSLSVQTPTATDLSREKKGTQNS